MKGECKNSGSQSEELRRDSGTLKFSNPVKFNPELLSREATHYDIVNDRLVKQFSHTAGAGSHTSEIMDGDDKGKWTTTYDANLIPLPVL